MVYNANTVRYLDNNNKSLIQFNDEYDKDGLLKKLTFSFIGVGSSSGNSKDNDFEKITVNDNPFLLKDGTLGAKEDLKNYILNFYNTCCFVFQHIKNPAKNLSFDSHFDFSNVY